MEEGKRRDEQGADQAIRMEGGALGDDNPHGRERNSSQKKMSQH